MTASASNSKTTVPFVSGPYVIETGSDMAEFCLFDVAALPEDLDPSKGAEHCKRLDALEHDGWLCRVRTGADGSYLLHVFVEQELPKQISERCGKPHTTATICTKRGEMQVRGTEDVGTSLANPERFGFKLGLGKHQVRIWEVRWQESIIAEAQKDRVATAMGQQAWERRSKRNPWSASIVVVLMLGGMLCLIASAMKTGRAYFGWSGLAALWVAWLAGIQIIPRLLNRADDERAALLEVETQKDFPDFVIQIRQTDAAA
jgi:hypothetical protein